MAAFLRGLTSKQEQDPGKLIRDTRTLGQRFTDFMKSPEAVSITLFSMAIATFFLQELFDLILLIGIVLFIIAITQKVTLPFKLPLRSGVKDHNDLEPGSGKPSKAQGIYFFGNDSETNEEMWFSNDDMRTHVLIFGSTGSGKTVTLVSIAYNALVQGSGFIYVDGKGDNSLFAQIFSMVRYMGREDDLLLINFMTGARDIVGPQKKRISNTMNPFSRGSSSMLAQLVVSLMDSGSGGSDGDMWKGRAIAFVEALMKVLVGMRDAGHILLDANTIRNYFELDRLEAMVLDKVFLRDDQDAISMEFLPEVMLQPMKNYLKTLPGWTPARKGKQVSQTLEQHGFITMQLTRVFTSLADTYGHILRVNLAEVDFKDVVLNRRIMAVLLPALEKSPDELANLGKVVIASLRAMMAAGLGDEVEGHYRDLITRKPTNAKTPFLCILDEYGYYAVQGFAVVPAQARSLGFSVVFAGQDLPAFQKASKEEAMSIGANTNIKICMKLEDPLETWDFFMKTAGESFVTQVENFATNEKTMTNQYQDTKSAKIEKRARVDLLDLKEQAVGEAHFFFKSKIVRGKTFYANPPPVERIRLNQFLRIEESHDRDMYKLAKSFEDFEVASKKSALFIKPTENSKIVSIVIEELTKNAHLPPIEAGVSVLIAYQKQVGEIIAAEQLDLTTGQINLFNKAHFPESLQSNIIVEDLLQHAAPLVERSVILEQMQVVERLMGKEESQALPIIGEIMKDIEVATFYPPVIEHKPQPEEVVEIIKGLIQAIHLQPDQGDAGGTT